MFIPSHGPGKTNVVEVKALKKRGRLRRWPRRVCPCCHQQLPTIAGQIGGVEHQPVDAQIGLQRIDVLGHQIGFRRLGVDGLRDLQKRVQLEVSEFELLFQPAFLGVGHRT